MGVPGWLRRGGSGGGVTLALTLALMKGLTLGFGRLTLVSLCDSFLRLPQRGGPNLAPKDENKWPEPRSDQSGSIQTHFALFVETIVCHFRMCNLLRFHIMASYLYPRTALQNTTM